MSTVIIPNLTNGTSYSLQLQISYGQNQVLYSPVIVGVPNPIPINQAPPLPGPNPLQSFTGYGFLAGFQEIDLGTANYDESSIYVSAPLKVNSTNIIGLNTTESRPYSNFTIDPNIIA